MPQTGELDSVKLVVIGFVLLAASFVLGFKKVEK
ncbi:LPXTG cell wall anchor domain-containing protein [Vagococcus entomophilus]